MRPTDSINAIVVAGPTASGKTALGLALAEQWGGEIVNYDSVQLYRDFDIGTAKPTAAELARARHHLIGAADAHAPWTAGEYARQARPVVEEIAGRGRMPILVGGTGFYLRALLEGLSPMPTAPAELRRRLQARSPERLRRLLERLDPEAAARIAPRDLSKTIRALEVRLLTGRSLAAGWKEAPPERWSGVRTIKLGLAPERAALYARIHRRAEAMFSGPIQEETRRLLPRYPAELRIWSSHGYKQACDIVLRGAEPALALGEAQLEQRHYAKRQWTWFRADQAMQWLAGFGDEAGVQRAAGAMVAAAIGRRGDRAGR
ncbi:MAG TPA: tRNA (adenosine(37)-N6)-dimethylallyltransferase MiaA [Terriglobales bacterium]|nr:tRNA (adenosine(37)-N6)-dimethylallyltransferase MiaA [Terriglobales bacterium]